MRRARAHDVPVDVARAGGWLYGLIGHWHAQPQQDANGLGLRSWGWPQETKICAKDDYGAMEPQLNVKQSVGFSDGGGVSKTATGSETKQRPWPRAPPQIALYLRQCGGGVTSL